MPNHVVAAIENYLDHGLKGSAILINGPWGVGKTHYLKQVLPSVAKRKSLKIVWISLYGLEHPKDVIELVAMGKIGESNSPTDLKQQVSSIFKDVLKGFDKRLASVPSLAVNLYGRFFNEDTILVVDDLERVAESASLMSALGVIQTVYAEKSNIKIICIGNESEISDQQNYFKSKEKIISHTVAFGGELFPAVQSISKEILSGVDMEMTLEECSLELTNYMRSLRFANLRTLTLALKAFTYFQRSLKAFSAKIERTLLYTLICNYKFIVELEGGELRNLSDVVKEFVVPSHGSIPKKTELHNTLYDLTVGGVSYFANVGDLFLTYHDVEIFISPNIVSYCRFLSCDLIQLQEELDSLQISIDQSTASPIIQIIKKIQGAVWLTDDDFEKCKCRFLELLPSSDFMESVSAASLVAQYEEYYLESGIDFGNLKVALLSLIDSSSTASVDHIIDFERMFSRDIDWINKREPEVAQSIRNRIAVYRTEREQEQNRTSWFDEFESITRSSLCLGLSNLDESTLRTWYDLNLENRSRMDKIATFLDKELPHLLSDLSEESIEGFYKLDLLLSSLEQSESYGYISKYWLKLHLKFLRAAMSASS